MVDCIRKQRPFYFLMRLKGRKTNQFYYLLKSFNSEEKFPYCLQHEPPQKVQLNHLYSFEENQRYLFYLHQFIPLLRKKEILLFLQLAAPQVGGGLPSVLLDQNQAQAESQIFLPQKQIDYNDEVSLNKGKNIWKNPTFLSISMNLTIHLLIRNTFILNLIHKQSKWLSESRIYKQGKTQKHQKNLFKSMWMLEVGVYSKYQQRGMLFLEIDKQFFYNPNHINPSSNKINHMSFSSQRLALDYFQGLGSIAASKKSPLFLVSDKV